MTAVDAPLGSFQQAATTPVREPKDERDAEGPDKRCSEDRVDRAHVRNHRAAAQTLCLACERGLEAGAAQRLVGRTERPDAAVRGQYPGNRTVREHDELVHELGERADLRHRRRQRGMPWVDLLGDEDDLSHCRSEEVEVAEREVPCVGGLVDLDTVVERLADEAELLVRGREASPQQRAPL